MTDSLIRDKIIMEINDKHLRTKIFNTENLNLLILIQIFNEHQNLQKKKKKIRQKMIQKMIMHLLKIHLKLLKILMKRLKVQIIMKNQ